MGEKRVATRISDEQIKEIATFHASGASLRDLEEQLGISRATLSRALQSDLAKQTVKEVQAEEIASKVLDTRCGLSRLLPETLDKLRSLIQEGNLKAIELVLRGAGVIAAPGSRGETATSQKQAIQIVFPGAEESKTILVNSGESNAV